MLAKHNQISCYLRTPVPWDPLAPSRPTGVTAQCPRRGQEAGGQKRGRDRRRRPARRAHLADEIGTPDPTRAPDNQLRQM